MNAVAGEDTRVGIAGNGPAVAAVRSAVEDTPATPVTVDADALGSVHLAVLVGVAGADGFRVANSAAGRADIPWIAVEAGGIGGRILEPVEASVAGFQPGTGCYRCLQLRVGAGQSTTPTAPEGERASTTNPDLRLAGAVAGRQVASILDGDPFTDVIEIPYRRRPIHRVPTCPICGSTRDRSIRRRHDAVDLDRAVSQAELAVDDRLGIVSTVGERDSYPSPYYLAVLASTEGFSDGSAMAHAAGTDPDWDRAYMKAIGEALERYAAGVYREAEFTTTPAAELEDRVLPSSFVRWDEAPSVEATEPVEWVDGQNLSTGTAVSLPAEFVHFPPPEETHRPAITTGLGLGTSMDGALRSGLMETMERDATMLAWYSTYEPVELAVTGDRWDQLRRRAASEDLDVRAYLLTQDVDVPVVGVAVGRDAWPKFAMGSAADFDGTAAATDALAEAIQNWMELRALGREDADQAGTAVARYADAPPTGTFDPHGTAGAAIPAADIGPAEPPTGGDAVDTALDRLAAADLTAYAARLTTVDLESLGFEAVRVLIPLAQPLFVETPYFGDRARTVPQKLGFEPRLERSFHPFP